MRYILPTNAIDKLTLLREQYQKEKNINLDEKPSMFGKPHFFGGVDVGLKNKQIKFIEKVLAVLRPNLKRIETIETPKEMIANLTASRLCLVATWYVDSLKSGTSVLSGIMDKAFGITAENYPDEVDKRECYATAKRLINTKNAFEDSNAALIKAGQEPFTETDWNDFSTFITEKQEKKVSTSTYSNYPITSITQPLFSAAFGYSGATIGLLGADLISQSTKAMSPQFQLTAFVGSSLLILGPAGPTGIALFAPVIASRLITSFCSITLAHVLGLSMALLGKGVGAAVGLPLDLAYRLLWKVCSVIGGYCIKEPGNPVISGMRIADGKMVISGIAIEITPIGKLPEGHIKQTIEFKEDGSIHVDGKRIIIPKDAITLPEDLLDELKTHLKKHSVAEIEGPKTFTKVEVLEETEGHTEEAFSMASPS